MPSSSPTRPTAVAAARGPRPTADERREQILEEALRCFASNGYRGTTTREIAGSVGITEAALYRYFPSKQSLYDALIDQKIGTPPLRHLVEEAAARRDDREVFSTLARAVLDRGLGDPDFLRLLFFVALEGHELSSRYYSARMGGLRSFVADYVGTRMREGAFRESDAELCARAFLGMVCDYLNVRIILAPEEAYPQSLEDVVQTLVDLFLAGMRAPGHASSPAPSPSSSNPGTSKGSRS